MPRDIPHPHLSIRFYMDTVKDKKATREQGRPIYKEVPMFEGRIVGDPTRSIVAPAHEKFIQASRGSVYDRQTDDDDDNPNPMLSYAEFYHEHWEVFQKDHEGREGRMGMPLEMLTMLPPRRIAELKARDVHTVEQLANLADRLLKDCGPTTRDERDLARALLDKSANAAAIAQAQAEKDAMQAQLDALKAQVAALASRPTAAAAAEADMDDLRAQLEARGIKLKGKHTPERLRAALAEAEQDDLEVVEVDE